MVRPKLASDEEVLHAAMQIMLRRGPAGFTITELAAKVGLSRAAIILRFKGAEELKAALMSEVVAPLIRALDQVPDRPGGDGLLKVAECIGGHIGSRSGSGNYFSTMGRNLAQNNRMLELERRRGQALRDAIARAMPDIGIGHEQAVLLFRAHLNGSILVWHGEKDVDAKTFLVAQTRQWLKVVGIPFTDTPAVAAPDQPAATAPTAVAAPATNKAAGQAPLARRGKARAAVADRA